MQLISSESVLTILKLQLHTMVNRGVVCVPGFMSAFCDINKVHVTCMTTVVTLEPHLRVSDPYNACVLTLDLANVVAFTEAILFAALMSCSA